MAYTITIDKQNQAFLDQYLEELNDPEQDVDFIINLFIKEGIEAVEMKKNDSKLVETWRERIVSIAGGYCD